MALTPDQAMNQLNSRVNAMRKIETNPPGMEAATTQVEILAEGARRALMRARSAHNVGVAVGQSQVSAKVSGPAAQHLAAGLVRQRDRGAEQVRAAIVSDLRRRGTR